MKGAAALLLVASAAGAETLECAPRFDVYCANAHVSCAGRSKVPAKAFRISFKDEIGEVTFRGGANVAMFVATSHSGRVLRAAESAEWIRIDPELNFSHRIRGRDGPLMSVGRCTVAE